MTIIFFGRGRGMRFGGFGGFGDLGVRVDFWGKGLKENALIYIYNDLLPKEQGTTPNLR